MKNIFDNQIKIYESIYEQIQDYESLLNKDSMIEIKEFSENIRHKIEDATKTERLLRIGIVGEVKAGKSTFLNALIFDGKQILPQAATPMTAALTKIVYSENLKAEVEFYNERDWDTIESYARDYEIQCADLTNEFKMMKKQNAKMFSNIGKNSELDLKEKEIVINKSELNAYINARVSNQSKSCYQLVEMLNKRNINYVECMRKGTHMIENISSIEDLMGKLENYVGAEGNYTPIVKSTKIYLNFDSLKGIEIIDTPGTNDPIVSRSMATRKNLSSCDVVFLLSYAGQFMKQQDVEFLSQVLPSEGIKKGIIVASKFDSVLLDTRYSDDFLKTLKKVTYNLTNHAKSIIYKEIEKDSLNKTLLSIKDSLPPVYVSPMAYIIGKKGKKNLDSNEQKIIENLEKRFKGFNFNSNTLIQFSNIQRIRDTHLNDIKLEKDKILEEKMEYIFVGQSKKIRDLISNLQKETEFKIDNLSNSNKKILDESLTILNKQSKKIEDKISNIFDNEIIDIQRMIEKLKLDIKGKYRDYDILEIDTKTSTSTSTSRGGFLWLKKTTTVTTTTTYEANIKESVDNIRNYIIDIEKCALNNFESIVNIKSIKDKLRDAIIDELDLNSKGIDEQQMLYSIDSTLKKLTIPKLDIDTTSYEDMIGNEFSGNIVKNEDIHKLERIQRNTLVKISDDVEHKLTDVYEKIEKEFTKYSMRFVRDIVSSLEKEINQIKEQLKNKDDYICKYNNIQVVLKKIKEDLIKINS